MIDKKNKRINWTFVFRRCLYIGLFAFVFYLLADKLTAPGDSPKYESDFHEQYEVEIQYDVFVKVLDTTSWCSIKKSARSVVLRPVDRTQEGMFRQCFDVAKIGKYNRYNLIHEKDRIGISLKHRKKYVTVPTVMIAAMIDNNLLEDPAKQKDNN